MCIYTYIYTYPSHLPNEFHLQRDIPPGPVLGAAAVHHGHKTQTRHASKEANGESSLATVRHGKPEKNGRNWISPFRGVICSIILVGGFNPFEKY